MPQSPEEKGLLGPLAAYKTINTHIHILEALTRLCGVVGDETVAIRLRELTNLIVGRAFVGPDLETIDTQTIDWKPVGRPSVLSYGHSLESVWLLLWCCKQVGIEPGHIIDLGRSVFRRADAKVFDRRRGGINTKPRRGRSQKVWWEQAETLLASLWMFDLTSEPTYRTYFLETLSWIYCRQVDWRFGGWHWYAPRLGQKAREKAGQWKTPYHEGRALLDSHSMLTEMSRTG
jgi:mannobiose 2-epimerase